MKVDVVHPNLYKVTKPGSIAKKYKTGVQDLPVKEAEKLIARGAAIATEEAEEAEEAEAKPAKAKEAASKGVAVNVKK